MAHEHYTLLCLVAGCRGAKLRTTSAEQAVVLRGQADMGTSCDMMSGVMMNQCHTLKTGDKCSDRVVEQT